MGQVGAWHTGVEWLDLTHAKPPASPLPERHLLAPGGRPAETHVANLYPVQQAQQCLLDCAQPQLEFHDLPCPGDFHQALCDLRPTFTLSGQLVLQATAYLLGECNEGGRLLQMTLNLLHRI